MGPGWTEEGLAGGRGGVAPAGRGSVRGALPSVWWAGPNYTSAHS